MLKTLYTCDQCGAEKKETNQWFVVYAHPSGGQLIILTFNPVPPPAYQHICGQACLVQAVSEFASRSGSASPAPSAHLGAARTAPVLSSDQPDTGRELVEDRG